MITVRHLRGTSRITAASLAEIKLQSEDSWVITDANVAAALGIQPRARTFVVAPGETSKEWHVLGRILEWLADSGATRRSRVMALGGGVIGDLAGFAAAAFMRGVPLTQVPTSLLAMVDSSVGGKTGIDLKSGKNLAGAFWPATDVFVCMESLKTLPIREWQCGSAEIWKYGAIMDVALWERLMQHPISAQCPHLEETVWKCIDHKRTVVESDEFETNGSRATLNFGHTVGHAIEWALQYQELTHGEAIAIGMAVESKIGEEIGVTAKGTAKVIKEGLERQGLPTELPMSLESVDLIPAMRRDKKANSGSLGMSLLETLGTCKLVEGVSEEAVSRILARS